jgi:hypothetical protein
LDLFLQLIPQAYHQAGMRYVVLELLWPQSRHLDRR